jgi:hypothetical protein
MFQQGVDPSSGAYQETSAALRRAQALGQGLGVSSAKVANTDRFYQGLGGIMAMGQGQASNAIEGMSSIARNAQEVAQNKAEAAFANSSAVRGGIAAGLGYMASRLSIKTFGRRPLRPQVSPVPLTELLAAGCNNAEFL